MASKQKSFANKGFPQTSDKDDELVVFYGSTGIDEAVALWLFENRGYQELKRRDATHLKRPQWAVHFHRIGSGKHLAKRR